MVKQIIDRTDNGIQATTTKSTFGNSSWWYWLALLWVGGTMLAVGIALLVTWLKEVMTVDGAVAYLLAYVLARSFQYGVGLIVLAVVFILLGLIGFRKA